MNSSTATQPFQPYFYGHQPLLPVNWGEWEVRDRTGTYRTRERTTEALERVLAARPIPTTPGKAVIRLYTLSGEFVSALNELLRRGVFTPIVLHIKDLLNASLRLLPAEQALIHEPLYRRIRRDTAQELKETLDRYEPGRIVTEPAFVSTSRGGVHERYPGNVDFVIYSHSGRDISEISAKSDEREVLIPAGTRFRVERVLPPSKSKPYAILLIEVK